MVHHLEDTTYWQRELAILAEEVVRLREELATCEHARPDPERLLLVVVGNGTIHVYGEPWHQVKCLYVPYASGWQEQEKLAEQMVDEKLPLAFRKLFHEGKRLVDGHIMDCPTQESLALSRSIKELMACLDRVAAL